MIALASGALFASPALGILHGLSIDLLTMLRWQAFGARHDPASAPVVVVAIDEESYQRPPFKGSPSITWTREIGRVLTAMLEGGARVVGFDVIFTASLEQSEMPFDGDLLGARVRGFDRDFLRALAAGARSGNVVLGEIEDRDRPVRPSPAQRIAVGQQRNIRPLNVYIDPDGVVRRLPLAFSGGGRRTPSMAVELASRALGVAPEFSPDETLTLAGRRFPSAIANTVTLNFDGGAEDILTFSFADLRACVEKDDKEFFRRHFGGKIVLVGTLLDIEDRKVTSKRLATGPEHAAAPRCALPEAPALAAARRASISGVYVHATAVNNLVRHDTVAEPGVVASAAIAILFAGLASVTALALTPAWAAGAYLGFFAACTAAATFAFTHSVALPLVEPFLAGLAAIVAITAYRFAVADREERFLRKSFALYLADEVIDRMMTANKLPALGGEVRQVTMFFSDIAGFSSFAEKMPPGTLVTVLNTYLSAMTDIIEDNGGYIDKYVGDTIKAIFGAPVDDPDHARNAVRAALTCNARLEELNRTVAEFQGLAIGHRIGLHSGEVLVGNIGSLRRFNYTSLGDAVNLASRLEGANKYFATSIMASQATVALTGTTFAWRELEAIKVMGRAQPVTIHELLAESGRQTPEQSAHAAIYAEGLACWRARDFAGAAKCLERTAAEDPPAALLLKRAKVLVIHPPGPDWEPVFTLEGK